jgi:hypothetical protein
MNLRRDDCVIVLQVLWLCQMSWFVMSLSSPEQGTDGEVVATQNGLWLLLRALWLAGATHPGIVLLMNLQVTVISGHMCSPLLL